MPSPSSAVVGPSTQIQPRPGDHPSTFQGGISGSNVLCPSPTPPLPDGSEMPDGLTPSDELPGGALQISDVTDPGPGLGIASHSQTSHVEDAQSTSDTVATYMGGYPVFESSKRTRDLVGSTFAPSSCHQERLLFVFSVRVLIRARAIPDTDRHPGAEPGGQGGR